jgi:hypothetical protein
MMMATPAGLGAVVKFLEQTSLLPNIASAIDYP